MISPPFLRPVEKGNRAIPEGTARQGKDQNFTRAPIVK